MPLMRRMSLPLAMEHAKKMVNGELGPQVKGLGFRASGFEVPSVIGLEDWRIKFCIRCFLGTAAWAVHRVALLQCREQPLQLSESEPGGRPHWGSIVRILARQLEQPPLVFKLHGLMVWQVPNLRHRHVCPALFCKIPSGLQRLSYSYTLLFVYFFFFWGGGCGCRVLGGFFPLWADHECQCLD